MNDADKQALQRYLRVCAENEGGRCRLAIEGYADIETAYYFAREAARYAIALLDSKGK